MKNRHIISVFFAMVLFLIFFSVTGKNDGGPPYNSKAPGDKSCSGGEGASACHGGGIADNAGPGVPSIIFNNGVNKYVPGQTYIIKSHITHPSFGKFGFQIVSLRNSDNKFAGTVTLIDTSKARMQKPTWGSYQDRNFVMHRLAGTVPVSPNTGEWAYSWKAPATNQGTITFYACFVTANNNNVNDVGDQTYSTSLAVTPTTIGLDEDLPNDLAIRIFPNPATTTISIESDNELSNAEVEIFNLAGKRVSTDTVNNARNSSIDVSNLSNGIYILQINVVNGKKEMHKFIKM